MKLNPACSPSLSYNMGERAQDIANIVEEAVEQQQPAEVQPVADQQAEAVAVQEVIESMK